MNYKLICVDMDGTLLNNKKEVSARNLETIGKAHEAGVKIVITTGRIFVSANYYGDLIGVKAPIIASNGAYVREKDKNESIYEQGLEKSQCRIIIDLLKKYHIIPQFYTSDTIYTQEIEYSALMYTEANKTVPPNRQVKIKIIDNWEEMLESDVKIIKAMAADIDKETIQEAKKEFLKLGEFEVVSSMNNSFELMKNGTSKGAAVKKICEYYGINRSETICIGDNENDLSMIKFAGLGVAMGNGTEVVKKEADYITLSNENDGVAHVIEKFVLKTQKHENQLTNETWV